MALAHVRLVKALRTTTLQAEIDGRTFTWRTSRRAAFAELAPAVTAAGGSVRRDRSPLTIALVSVLIAAAALTGALGGRLHEKLILSTVTELRSINLTIRDLPGAWTEQASSPLAPLVGPANQVTITKAVTTTSSPAATSPYAQAERSFFSCLPTSNATDRIFGAAGQQPLYQVSSPVFSSTVHGGIQVASSAQYYLDTSMVTKDTAEMARARFGACFANANADLILSAIEGSPQIRSGVAHHVSTFAKGFSVVGEASLPGVASATVATMHLIVAVVTAGHYEVTMLMIAADYAAVSSLVSNLVNTLLSRSALSSGAAV